MKNYKVYLPGGESVFVRADLVAVDSVKTRPVLEEVEKVSEESAETWHELRPVPMRFNRAECTLRRS